MKEKTFSKKSFKKSQDIASLFFLLILAIAVASLICAFAVGEGLLPKDLFAGPLTYESAASMDASELYGDYYGINNYILHSLSLTKDKMIVRSSNGLKNQDAVTEIGYKYLSAEDAQTLFAKEDYIDCPALVSENLGNGAYIVIWVCEDGLYYNAVDTVMTEKRVYLEEAVNDPRDYYTTYTYNSNSYVTFNQDGTATFSLNGDVDEFLFIYVDKYWKSTHSEYESIISGNKALLLYQEDSNKFQHFEYRDKYTLWYGSQSNFEFTGTGSAFFPYEEEEPDYSDPDYSDPDYSDPDYSDPDYSDPDYSDPDYSDPDSGSGDGTGDDGDDSGNSGDSFGSTDEPITELKAEHLDFSSTYACAYDYYGDSLYEVEIDEDGTIYITESGVSYMITENIVYLYYDGDYMAVGDATDVLNEYVPYLDYVDIVNRFEYDPYYEEFYCSYGENDIYIGLNNDGSVSSIRIIDQYDYYNRLSFAFSSNN